MQWVTDSTFRLNEVTFAIDFERPSTAERLTIRKPRDLIEDYVRLIAERKPMRLVELGIAGGGSTALLAHLTGGEVLAFEKDPDPLPGLAEHVEVQGLKVSTWFDVDQVDAASLFDGTVDLVVDDASHLYAESRTSFMTLFPRLRPGGLYVLEDWAAHDRFAAWEAAAAQRPGPHPRLDVARDSLLLGQEGRRVPLSRLVLELVLARATIGDAFGDLTIGRHWVTIERGPGELDPALLDVDPFDVLA